MLPVQLSEELCSLRPDVERLAFTANFVLDEQANIMQSSFCRSVIKWVIVAAREGV